MNNLKMNENRQNSYLLWIFPIFGLLVLLTTITGVYRSYSPVPFWDEWNGYLQFYMNVTDGNWSAWWAQHNEHRVVFSRILFWLDLKYFDGKLWVLLVGNIFLQFINVLLLLYVAEKICKTNKSMYLVVIGFIFSFLFSWGQHVNFTWGFQSQFIAVYMFSLSALIYIVSIENSSKKWTKVLFPSFLAICASLSMANGLLIFPLLIITALFLRLPLSNLLTIFSVASITYIAYFFDYIQPVEKVSIIDSVFNHPIEIFKFVLLYIGSPFYQLTGSMLIGEIFGSTFISISAYLSFNYIKSKHKDSNKLILLVFLLFIGGTALATASGRINFGLGTALSSRYMTPAYLGWASLLILIAGSIKNNNNKILLNSSLIIILIGVLVNQKSVFGDFSDMQFKRKMAILSLNMGSNDDTYLREIYPNRKILQEIASEAKKRRISVFNNKSTDSFMLSLDSKKKINCSGNNEEITLINNNYFRIKGWSYKENNSTIPDRIIFVNSNGNVVGKGLIGQPRPDVATAISEKARNSGWQGYIPTGAGNVTAYAIYGQNFCKIPGHTFSAFKPDFTVILPKNSSS